LSTLSDVFSVNLTDRKLINRLKLSMFQCKGKNTHSKAGVTLDVTTTICHDVNPSKTGIVSGGRSYQ